jgi:hypothetical protein
MGLGIISQVANQPIDMYITEAAKGYLISENPSHEVIKKYIRNNHPDIFNTKTYWNLTLTQILVGLSPEQARFFGKVDNEKEKIQYVDTLSSVIKVCSKDTNTTMRCLF